MELPRELWEGQNMKVVTHKCVNIDDPFGKNDRDRCVRSFYGGMNPLQSSNVSYFMLNMIVSSSLPVMISGKYCLGGGCDAHPEDIQLLSPACVRHLGGFGVVYRMLS